MDRAEFLRQLEAGLAGAAPDERVAAMQYYGEYLDEAGPEREAGVLAELGDPQKLAGEILGASGGEAVAAGAEWTPPTPPPRLAHGQPFSVPPPQSPKDPFDHAAPEAPEPPGAQAAADALPLPVPQYSRANTNTLKIVLAALVLIILIPALGGILTAVAVLLGTAVVLALLPFFIGVALVAAGILTIVAGSFITAASVGTGLFVMGSGILAVGIGLLCFMGGVQLVGKAVPAMFRGVAGGVRFIKNKIKGFFGVRGENNG